MVVKELLVKLGVQSKPDDFKKAENGMERLVDFAKKAAVAFASFKLGKWIKGIVDEVAVLGDKFDKMEARTGVLAKTLQELGYGAELTGTDVNVLEIAIRTAQRTADEAAAGVATYKDEYDRLGVSVKDSTGRIKSFDELLPEISDGLSKLKTDTEKAAVAQKIFGRSGTQWLPMLKLGKTAISEYSKEFNELGAVIDKDLQKQSADYIDNQTRLKTVMQGIKNIIGSKFLPVFNKLIDSFIKWFRINREWIALKIGSLFENISKIVKNISNFFGSIIKNIISWGKGLGNVETRILKIVSAVAGIALILALPAGSILLLIALIGLLIDDFQTWKEGGDSLFGSIIKWIEEIFGFDLIGFFVNWWKAVKITIEKISQTLAGFVMFFVDIFSGKINKAWDRLNKGMLNVWGNTWKDILEISKYVEIKIGNLFFSLFEFIKNIVIKIGKFFINIGSSIYSVFIEGLKSIKDFFEDLYTTIIKFLSKVWNKIVEWSKNIVDKISAPFRKIKSLVSDLFDGEDTKIAVEPILKKTLESDVIKLVGSIQKPVFQKTVPSNFNRTRIINSPSNSINVNVTTTNSNIDEQSLSNKIVTRVQEELDRMNQSTLDAFIPAE